MTLPASLALAAVGLVLIVLAGRIAQRLGGQPAQWVAPATWAGLVIVWESVLVQIGRSGYDIPATFGSSSEDLRGVAIATGAPLIALCGVALLKRWRLALRHRSWLWWTTVALIAVNAIGVLVGLASGNALTFVVGDAWRWAAIPLVVILAVTDERPRPLFLFACVAAAQMLGFAVDVAHALIDVAQGTFSRTGTPGAILMTATVIGLWWCAANGRPRQAWGLGMLMATELVFVAGAGHRTHLVTTTAVLVLAALGVALIPDRGALPWRLALRPAAILLACVAIVLAGVAALPVGREHATKALDRWNAKVASQRVVTAATAPAERELLIPPQYKIAPPAYGSDCLRGPRDIVYIASSTKTREEEIERSIDELLRGAPASDVVHLALGAGQGAQYCAPTLPALTSVGAANYRHHIHVTYVNVLFRNGVIGLVALIALILGLLAAAAGAIRGAPLRSTTGAIGRFLLIVTLVGCIEMLSGFAILGRVQWGGLVAVALLLATTKPQPPTRGDPIAATS